MVDSARPGPGGQYTERAVAHVPAVPAHRLMGRLLAH